MPANPAGADNWLKRAGSPGVYRRATDRAPQRSLTIRANLLGQSFDVPAYLYQVSPKGTVIFSAELRAFFRTLKTLTGSSGSLAFDYRIGGAADA